MTTVDLPALDWEGVGYVALLERDADPNLAPWWVQWLSALQKVVAGDFSDLPLVMDEAAATSDPVFRQSCSFLLGDAGGAGIAERIRSRTNSTDFDLMLECCGALAEHGWLADVPLLLDVLRRHSEESEANIITVLISDLLTPNLGELPDAMSEDEGMDAFADAVLDRYNQLVDRLGTPRVFVFGVFGVARFAEWLREQTRRPHFRFSRRRRFEAATGIDCSAFYESPQVSALGRRCNHRGVPRKRRGGEIPGWRPVLLRHRIPE